MTDGLQKAYEELRQTQQVVVQQERLRALGQMASGVAHDVNNALSPVVAYSEILLLTLPDLPEESRHYLEIIKHSGEDIAQIVARMREFYRRRSDSEPLVLVDLNQTIKEVIELTRPRWRDISQRDGISIEIQQELERHLPLLSERPQRIAGSPDQPRLQRRGRAPARRHHYFGHALPPGSVSRENAGAVERRLQVEVRDNGIGMDENAGNIVWSRSFPPRPSTAARGWDWRWFMAWCNVTKATLKLKVRPAVAPAFASPSPSGKRLRRPIPGPCAKSEVRNFRCAFFALTMMNPSGSSSMIV